MHSENTEWFLVQSWLQYNPVKQVSSPDLSIFSLQWTLFSEFGTGFEIVVHDVCIGLRSWLLKSSVQRTGSQYTFNHFFWFLHSIPHLKFFWSLYIISLCVIIYYDKYNKKNLCIKRACSWITVIYIGTEAIPWNLAVFHCATTEYNIIGVWIDTYAFYKRVLQKKTYESQIWSLFFAIHRKIIIDPHKLYMVGKGRSSALKCILICQNQLRIEATRVI